MDKEFRDRILGIAKANYDAQVEPGNIDTYNRPVLHNQDGSISTVRTMGIDEGTGVTNIPTISPTGTSLTPEQAIDLYRVIGKHLGKFKNVGAADESAQNLHEQQAQYYRGR